MNDTLIGVIIGAIISSGFTWFIEWRKAIAEQKIHLREKREGVYEMMLKTFQSLRNNYLTTKGFNIPDAIYANFEEISNLLKMYASSDTEKKYNAFMDDFEKDYRKGNNDGEAYEKAMQYMEELKAHVRQEIGIKD